MRSRIFSQFAPAVSDEVELGGDRRSLDGVEGDPVGLAVVGVVVATHVVVGDDHGRLVLLEQLGQPRPRVFDGDVAEHIVPVLELPLCHPRIVVTEGFHVGNGEPVAGHLQLAQARACDLLRMMTRLAWLGVPGSVTILAVGASHDDRPHALVCVTGQDATSARRLVIGVGMDCHERQPV